MTDTDKKEPANNCTARIVTGVSGNNNKVETVLYQNKEMTHLRINDKEIVLRSSIKSPVKKSILNETVYPLLFVTAVSFTIGLFILTIALLIRVIINWNF